MADDLTFFSSSEIECPVCGSKFKKEEMRTGGGRINAGEITRELRRKYLPTKYGIANPLLYVICVCPDCYYAAEKQDFSTISPEIAEKLGLYREVRGKYIIKIFGSIPDFREKRDLKSGASSYILAASCYSFFDRKKTSPSFLSGLCFLRAAWLFSDLYEETKDEKFNELMNLFYRRAADLYLQAINNMPTGKERLDSVKLMGPDTDKNYGFDGVLYITALLKYRYAKEMGNLEEKAKTYGEIKRLIAKVFGMGKKTKDKPQILLDNSREIYDEINKELETMGDYAKFAN